MCVDYKDLNKACPKDLYPLLNIDRLVDGAAGHKVLSFLDKIFKGMIGKSVEVYVDDIVVKSDSCDQHIKDLQEVFDALRRVNMRLNPEKCAFGVEGGKFLGFMLTHRGIEANPDKCKAIVEMRSPSNLKEIQQLLGRLTTLSRFVPRRTNQAHSPDAPQKFEVQLERGVRANLRPNQNIPIVTGHHQKT